MKLNFKQFIPEMKSWRFYLLATITFILGLFFGPEVMEVVTPVLENVLGQPEIIQDTIAPIIDTVQVVIDTVTVDTAQ